MAKFQFSNETVALMEGARLIAIELGYDHISTLHFFLSDCKNERKDSIRNFSFRTEEDFKTFYQAQRVGDSSIFIDTLPITMEAERTIYKAIKIRDKLKEKQVRPCHLFLAATQLPESHIYSMLEPKQELFQRLENFYIRNDTIKKL